MYCRNCGNGLEQGAYVCMKCGVPAGQGREFCPNCGAKTDVNAVFCVSCGVSFVPPPQQYNQGYPEQKSKLVAALLAFFLGVYGAHNFYLGYNSKAVTQLLLALLGGVLTCGLSTTAVAIWVIVEAVQLLTGSIAVDANGYPLKNDC